MLPYFKRYSIYVCVIAVALPVAASTAWPLLTGQMMASQIGGLVGMLVLFAAGLFIGYAVFGRRADALTESYLAKYNDDCDPQALIDEGASLAKAIRTPCDQSGSWFLGYYAQALLEVGRADEAKAVRSGLRESVDAAKTPAAKLGILVNLLPLEEKVEGDAAAAALAEEGAALCEQMGDAAGQLGEFVDGQRKVIEAKLSDDPEKLASLAEAVRESDRYPARIRVEYAWQEASARYRLGDSEGERLCLRFVEENGGSLALARKARERLAAVGA